MCDGMVLKNNRILSLDVFRGLTIILMILVNSQGKSAYPLLEHAVWNGCTFADLVFPSFLFIVGITCVISLKRYKDTSSYPDCEVSDRGSLYRSILQRSLILFALGLFLNVFPHFINFSSLRVYGVLQRIAVCYLISGIIYLNTTIKTQLFIFVALLLGYWLIMTQVPVPGHGVNQLTMDGSWVAYIDQLLFSSPHLFGKTYDPEGLFSTIPAVATTLCGVLIGSLLLTSISNQRKFYLISALGLLFLFLGWIWSYSFPINKNLWTSSFVLWSSGYALISFALCFLIIDMWGYQKWALPLKIFGMNALFAFTFHVILLKIQYGFKFHLNNGTMNMREILNNYLLGGFNTPNSSFFYSLGFLCLNFIVVAYLYKRKLFIKI
jgi:predicted acyltransferase